MSSATESSGSRNTIFAALQAQLGLRLEAERGSIDFLVINSVERPTSDYQKSNCALTFAKRDC